MAGKKKYPKKPKAPRRSASIGQHEAFHKRMAEWQKRCREIDKLNSKHAAVAKKTETLKRK